MDHPRSCVNPLIFLALYQVWSRLNWQWCWTMIHSMTDFFSISIVNEYLFIVEKSVGASGQMPHIGFEVFLLWKARKNNVPWFSVGPQNDTSLVRSPENLSECHSKLLQILISGEGTKCNDSIFVIDIDHDTSAPMLCSTFGVHQDVTNTFLVSTLVRSLKFNFVGEDSRCIFVTVTWVWCSHLYSLV